ncbi:lipoyl synthase [uncultured Bacteroides sp.]|uniref:lipoyl synthase n=1 Tax=uncultured Bacteroides sp. TaxID=162156 RepID=UPI002619D485|nr:lipoyl synthase [uncultured Bacteroides sp.]
MTHIRKPEWLKISISANAKYAETKKIVDTHKLHTICSSGRCPNMGECWGKGTATFMICGAICTRSCKFCNTCTGKPLPLDENEPANVAESIRLMKLNHAVITSVDRDDLEDLGASHWTKTLLKIKEINPETTIEALIPDFQGKKDLISQVISARPDILSHNMETVRRISPMVRSVAKYDTSLKVIKLISECGITAKSGIMVGLGESKDEVLQTMDDLLEAGCKILTIGQYLQPTHKHYPVAEYITPEQFCEYKTIGEKKGFQTVESGPLVRSSYHAEKHIVHK